MKDKIIGSNQFKTQENDERKKAFSKKMASIISYQENVKQQDRKHNAV